MTFQIPKIIFILLISLFCCQSIAMAANLTQYREKIESIYESIDEISYEDDSMSKEENDVYNKKVVKDIIAELSPTEKIELSGNTIEVSNEWLLSKLKEYSNEKYESKRSNEIVNELLERLAVLKIKLNELETQQLSNLTKDEEKQKLDEILKRDEYKKPKEAEETWLQRKWREFWEWIDSLLKTENRREIPDQQIGSPTISNALVYVIVGIAILAIGFLIYRFLGPLIEKIRKRDKRERKSRVILGEVISADEDSNNIFAEAENLARNGNLREAIRKGYIAFLCELSDRKIIGLSTHKTNRDYLRDVSKRKELHQKMNSLTNNFERNWYGLRKTEEIDWEEFKQNYQQAVNSKS